MITVRIKTEIVQDGCHVFFYLAMAHSLDYTSYIISWYVIFDQSCEIS